MDTLKHSVVSKAVAALTASVMVMSAFVGFATPVSAATDVSTLCDLAEQLGIESAEFDALCSGSSSSSSSSASAGEYVHHPSIDFEFTRNLYIGSRGNDVMMLQKVLNLDPDTRVSVSGAGSPGNETEYFGPATRAAVAKFQAKWGIAPAAGYFYPLTRAEMNKRAAGSSSSNNDDDDHDDDNSSDDELEVEEGDHPDDLIVNPRAQRVPVTAIELTAKGGDAEIDYILVGFTGSADEDTVDSVVLLDENGMVVGDDDSLDSDDEAEIGDNLMIEKGDTWKGVIAVNMADFADNEDGGDFSIEVLEVVADVDVDDKDVPFEGAEHSPNHTDDIDEADVDVETEGGTVDSNDTNELFATVEVDANPSDSDDSLFVRSLRLENNGTGDLDDLDNIHMEVDGEDFDGEVDDDYIFFDFGNDGFEIEDGDTEDFELFADVVGDAANETFVFAFDEEFDIDIIDEDGVGVAVNLTTSGSAVSVDEGTVSVNSSDDDESDEVSVGDDRELMMFEIDVDNEDVNVDEWLITIAIANGDHVSQVGGTLSSSRLSDLLIEDVVIATKDGDEITDTEDMEWQAGSPTNSTDGSVAGTMEATFDNFDIEEGDDVTFVVMGRIDDNVDNGTQYTVTVDAANMVDVEGKTSDENITPTGSDTGAARTVEAADLELDMSSSPAATNIDDDQDDVVFAKFQLDASNSGEDIEVTSIDDVLLNASGDAGDLQSCRAFVDGDEVELQDEVEGDTGTTRYDFEFEDDLLVEKDTLTTVEIRCDVGNANNGDTFSWQFDGTTSVDADGADTSNDVTATVNAGTSNTMTVADATLEVSAAGDSPSTMLLPGETEVVLGILELEGDDGDVIAEDLELEITTGNTEFLLNEKVEVYHDNNLVGTANFSSGVIDFVEDIDVEVEDGDTEELEFRATIAKVGDGEDGDDGAQIELTVNRLDTEDNDVTTTGIESDGGAENGGTSIAFDNHYIFGSVPTITLVSDEDDLTNGDNTAMVFSVKADEAGDIYIGGFEVDVDVTGAATVGDTRMEVFSDSGLSNQISVSGTDEFNTGGSGGSIDFQVGGNFVEISAGDTYYFRVRLINVAGVVGDSGDNVRVEILEDTTFTTGTQAALTAANHNFIWTTDDGEDADAWFNGFEVEGADNDIKANLSE